MQLQEYTGARIGGYAARRYTVIGHVAVVRGGQSSI